MKAFFKQIQRLRKALIERKARPKPTGPETQKIAKVLWNWGAFWLGPIWALSHRIWLGLLCGVPLLIASIQIWLAIHFGWSYEMYIPFQEAIAWWSLLLSIGHLLGYPIGIALLAINGNRWAWQKNDYKSVEHFEAIQRRWAVFGWLFGPPISCVLYFGPPILFFVSIVPFMVPYIT